MAAPPKLAVVLMNLGGPSEEAALAPFLFNFFMDKYIIRLPLPLRYFVARWLSWRRSRGAAREAYHRLGGISPLLPNTAAQAQALEKALQDGHTGAKVFVAMRHWHPFAAQVVREVAGFNPDKIVLLPLYPQFSTTTSLSSLQNWRAAAKKHRLARPTVDICCYPADPGFIGASAELVRAALKEAPKKVRVLFSAHGLPEKIIRQGDPYQEQCERTAAAIVRRLDIPLLDWRLCYQSKIGRLRWTGPSLEQSLKEAAADQVAVLVYPCAFVSEHVETLVEIDVECRARARHLGIPYFAKVPTVGTHPEFIAGLKNLVLSSLDGAECKKTCSDRFNKCHSGVKND